MINVRNLYVILSSCESCNRENHPNLWPQGEIAEDKYVPDNQRTHGALWYIGW